MTSLRRLLLDHRTAAAWLLAAALLMRMLVPAGFMPVVEGTGITITLCSGYGPQTVAMPAAMKMAMPGMDHQDGRSDHRGGDMPCGFGALAAPSLAAADPLLLAAAIAFVMATVFRAPVTAAVAAPPRLRPPARAPPAPSAPA